MKGWAGSSVHPVQIHTSSVRAIVASVNSVRVQHRHQLKDILSAKCRCPRIFFIEEKFEDSEHHKGGAGFPRVDSCREKDDFLPRKAVGSGRLLCLWKETRGNQFPILGDGVDPSDCDKV